MTTPLWLVSPEEAAKKCELVTEFPVNPDLLAEMYRVMKENRGVGLAAPQVGIPMAMFIFELPKGDGPHVVCNPQVTVLSDRHEWMLEGCLTLPGQIHSVLRFKSIRVDFQDENGKETWWNCRDYMAQVIQHEVMHLQGRLINYGIA